MYGYVGSQSVVGTLCSYPSVRATDVQYEERGQEEGQQASGRGINSGGGQQTLAAIRRAVGAVTCDQRSHQQEAVQGGSPITRADGGGAKGHVGSCV